jgi:2'-5' RNA ligase
MRLRVFVAIPISNNFKKQVENIRPRLLKAQADVKWVETENYHLTVKFLGNVEESQLDGVIQALRRAGDESPPFTLVPRGTGFFPNHRRPRVFWIGINGELDKAFWLGERVDAYLAELGFEVEKKRRYHLTLGRLRSEKNAAALVQAAQEVDQAANFQSFTVNEMRLMQSQLNREGPTYSVIKTFPLQG